MTTTPQEVRTAPVAGSYELDQSHSHVSFSARHLMVTKVRGRFPVTAGKLVIGEPLKNFVGVLTGTPEYKGGQELL